MGRMCVELCPRDAANGKSQKATARLVLKFAAAPPQRCSHFGTGAAAAAQDLTPAGMDELARLDPGLAIRGADVWVGLAANPPVDGMPGPQIPTSMTGGVREKEVLGQGTSLT